MAKEVTAAQVADKALDKAGNFVEKAAATASNIFEAASNIIAESVAKYGQHVVDAVLWVVRIDALQQLFIGWIVAIMFISWIVMWVKGLKSWDWPNRFKKYFKIDDSFSLLFPAAIATIIFSTIFVTISLPRIVDVWLYTAVAKPELYLAKQAVDIVKHKIEKSVR